MTPFYVLFIPFFKTTVPIARPTVQYPRLAAYLADCSRHRGTLPYHGVQGYLFIMQNSVCVTDEEECHRGIFGAGAEGAYRKFCARRELVNDLAELQHNIAERGPSLLDDCALRSKPSDNFRHDAPVRQWALGFLRGYAMVRDWWARPLPRLHSAYHEISLVCLTAFADREAATRNVSEYLGEDVSLEWVAAYAHRTFDKALAFFIQSCESDVRDWYEGTDHIGNSCSGGAYTDYASAPIEPSESPSTVDHRFLAAYLRYSDRLRRYLQEVAVSDHATIEAVLRDTFLAFYLRLHRGEITSAPALTLFRIAEEFIAVISWDQVAHITDDPIAQESDNRTSRLTAVRSTVPRNRFSSAWNEYVTSDRNLIRSLIGRLPRGAFMPYFYHTVLHMPFPAVAKRCEMTESQAIIHTYHTLKLRHDLLHAPSTACVSVDH